MSGFGSFGLFDDELAARRKHIKSEIRKSVKEVSEKLERDEEPFTERELALIDEAFITGRIYTIQGEKESPARIQEKLIQNCKRAVRRVGL